MTDEKPKGKGSMRDRYSDREAAKEDENPDERPPDGTMGPTGKALDDALGEGGEISPDTPEEIR
jgi:hypothetical protein